MLKTSLVTLVVVAALLTLAPQASAQAVIRSGPGVPPPGSVGMSYTRGYTTLLGGNYVTRAEVTASYPYSYYAAFPYPAREYVPYGSNDLFPFYGRPYGHPYDRWSWQYMSTGPAF